ncbi:MAG: rRNA maturation RNase YbeY [Mariprofundaceae bacterium]|nr:rRNA maturation RNase YbeY [Mariprofundaceae bacterium]
MIDLIYDEGVEVDRCPSSERMTSMLRLVCDELALSHDVEVCLRFASDEAVLALNTQWRDKPSCTDVLSFPQQDGPDFNVDEPLGDIVLAVGFVEQEALRLALPFQDHVCHLVIHGLLHLLAYDHEEDDEAQVMQALETLLMAKAGLHCPYPESTDA